MLVGVVQLICPLDTSLFKTNRYDPFNLQVRCILIQSSLFLLYEQIYVGTNWSQDGYFYTPPQYLKTLTQNSGHFQIDQATIHIICGALKNRAVTFLVCVRFSMKHYKPLKYKMFEHTEGTADPLVAHEHSRIATTCLKIPDDKVYQLPELMSH